MSNQEVIYDEKFFENYPQHPHGGRLINKVLTGKAKEEGFAKAKSLPKIMIDLEAVITIEMIATGVLSPNEGFMNQADYESVLKEVRLANGLIWPVPLSFAQNSELNQEIVASLSVNDAVTLVH